MKQSEEEKKPQVILHTLNSTSTVKEKQFKFDHTRLITIISLMKYKRDWQKFEVIPWKKVNEINALV